MGVKVEGGRRKRTPVGVKGTSRSKVKYWVQAGAYALIGAKDISRCSMV